jgi:hypothetical protein
MGHLLTYRVSGLQYRIIIKLTTLEEPYDAIVHTNILTGRGLVKVKLSLCLTN